MRLKGMTKALQEKIDQNTATDVDILDLDAQLRHGASLLAIGRGLTTPHIQCIDSNDETGRMLLRLEGFPYFTNEEEVIAFLYPEGISFPNMF